MLTHYFKKSFLSLVIIGFSSAYAGVYEDFMRAIHSNDVETVRHLVEVRGVDPNWPNEQGEPALVLALTLESNAVADYLARSPLLKTELTNVHGETPLMLAAIRNQMALAQALIERGAEVNRPGWTPLHYAAARGHIAMMRLLLDQSAYIDAESPHGQTPLMMAAEYGTPMSVKLLLEEGADPHVRNRAGQSALDVAQIKAQTQSAQFIQVFLEAWEFNALRERGLVK